MSLSVRYIPKNGTAKSKLTGLTMLSILLQRRLYQFMVSPTENACAGPLIVTSTEHQLYYRARKKMASVIVIWFTFGFNPLATSN